MASDFVVATHTYLSVLRQQKAGAATEIEKGKPSSVNTRRDRRKRPVSWGTPWEIVGRDGTAEAADTAREGIG
jgi:hypothetical protein